MLPASAPASSVDTERSLMDRGASPRAGTPLTTHCRSVNQQCFDCTPGSSIDTSDIRPAIARIGPTSGPIGAAPDARSEGASGRARAACEPAGDTHAAGRPTPSPAHIDSRGAGGVARRPARRASHEAGLEGIRALRRATQGHDAQDEREPDHREEEQEHHRLEVDIGTVVTGQKGNVMIDPAPCGNFRSVERTGRACRPFRTTCSWQTAQAGPHQISHTRRTFARAASEAAGPFRFHARGHPVAP